MRFMLQSQTIEIINVDNKVQIEKEMWKHGNMLPISIRVLSAVYQTAAIQTC